MGINSKSKREPQCAGVINTKSDCKSVTRGCKFYLFVKIKQQLYLNLSKPAITAKFKKKMFDAWLSLVTHNAF